jgi:hypothetical protein
MGFRAVREGFLLFASKARCGPIPLRWVALGCSEYPNGARIPARGETPGIGAQPERSEGTLHTPDRP